MSDYIAHHGVKGQRWGVRKYVDENGKLTELGKKQYARDNATIKYKREKALRNQEYKQQKSLNEQAAKHEKARRHGRVKAVAALAVVGTILATKIMNNVRQNKLKLAEGMSKIDMKKAKFDKKLNADNKVKSTAKEKIKESLTEKISSPKVKSASKKGKSVAASVNLRILAKDIIPTPSTPKANWASAITSGNKFGWSKNTGNGSGLVPKVNYKPSANIHIKDYKSLLKHSDLNTWYIKRGV